MSDNPLFKTPGEMISEGREALDLTIAQLSERTKIPPPVLSALELDEYHKISGSLYIKSFLRTCALDLGLDPQIVLSMYNRVSGERKAEPVGSEMVWGEEEVMISRVGLPRPWIIMAAGVMVFLVGLVLFALRGCGDGGPAQEEGSSVAASGTAPDETTAAFVPGDSVASPLEGQDVASSLPDTLAAGWILNPPTPGAEQENTSQPAAGGDKSAEQDLPVEIVVEAPPVTVATPEEIDPEDPQSDPPVETPIDSAWPLVLRIVCDAPQEIQVKRDGDRDFSRVRWPADREDGPAVPAAGFEAGRAYRQGNRLMVFWGAEDHFSLKLARIHGVEVSINGRVWDVGRLRPGQELVLDSHFADTTPHR